VSARPQVVPEDQLDAGRSLTARVRGGPFETDCTFDARIELSEAGQARLRGALSQGHREFVLTTRDGAVTVAITLSAPLGTVTEHRIAGHTMTVDWRLGVLTRGSRRIVLSRTELRLFAMLVEAAGAPLSRGELVARLWPGSAMAAPDRLNALTVYVCSLRKRLLAIGAGSALVTVRGVGYRLLSQ
jgi:DNA-binding winged helix-turn-helix (wHTH) protein